MTLYTIDSNAETAILRPDQRVLSQVRAVLAQGDEVTLNAVSYFEVKRGLVSPRFQRKLTDFHAFAVTYGVLDLDLPSLDRAADVYQVLRAAGTPLEDADLLVAGIALSRDAVLVTRNLRHLGRVPGLRLEDWESQP